jgi:hypothetical protein
LWQWIFFDASLAFDLSEASLNTLPTILLLTRQSEPQNAPRPPRIHLAAYKEGRLERLIANSGPALLSSLLCSSRVVY